MPSLKQVKYQGKIITFKNVYLMIRGYRRKAYVHAYVDGKLISSGLNKAEALRSAKSNLDAGAVEMIM